MSLLLTGATGFLGRNILLRALSEGTEVFTAVRNAGKLWQQLRFEKKDLQEIHVTFRAARSGGQESPRAARFSEAGSSSNEIAVITFVPMSIGLWQLFARYLRNAARWSSRRSRLVVLRRTAGRLARRRIPMPPLPGTGNPNSRWSARSVASFQIGRFRFCDLR